MSEINEINSDQKYDLVIAYRIYPGVSKIPFIHADNKLKLAEAGIRSLKLALSDLKARMYCIMDNCPTEYETMIENYFNPEDVEFIRFNGVGNLKTFGVQIETLLNQTYSEVVFFAEDDYIYRKDTINSAIQLIKKNPQAHFITPYDHPDSYSLKIHNRYKYKIISEGGLHWRTTGSTCLTFMTTRKILNKSKNAFFSYCKGNWDSSLWFALTKYNVLSPAQIIIMVFHDTFLLKVILLSWIKTWKNILFSRKYFLWQPIPSIATHMESTGIAPNIDWIKVVGEQESEN
jgi:hypothetical protein